MKFDEDKIIDYATAFMMVSTGVLALAFVPGALGIKRVQKAQAFNLMADGHRMLSLARTYDAKATAKAIKAVSRKIL